MYRKLPDLQVLLVHPGGPFWREKDVAAWTIPKGEVKPDEDPVSAAKREFHEETGAEIAGNFLALPPVKQRGGKVVHAWAVEGDFDVGSLKSNTFSMEWPPKSGKQVEFPEVDRAAFFDLDIARSKINPSQIPLLDAVALLAADHDVV